MVQQYGGSSPFTTISGFPAQGTNLDIQQAIWSITNNTEFQGHNPGNGYDGGTNYSSATDGVKYWLTKPISTMPSSAPTHGQS